MAVDPQAEGVPHAVSINGDGSNLGDLLSLEIDGPDIHPHSVDAVSLLELAAAFFSLVTAEAAQSGHELRFESIEIRDKCALIAARPSDYALARVAAQHALHVLDGSAAPPRGGADQVRRFNKAAKAFDKPDHRLLAGGTGWQAAIVLPNERRARPMTCMTTFRAKPVRVGGTNPAVRFSSDMERDEFTLDAGEDLARSLGTHLYRDVEIEALIERARDGSIQGGEVLSFRAVDTVCEDPWGVWEQWYQDVNREPAE